LNIEGNERECSRGTITLPIVDCQLPIENIVDCPLPIANWENPAGCVTPSHRGAQIGNWQSTIGNVFELVQKTS